MSLAPDDALVVDLQAERASHEPRHIALGDGAVDVCEDEVLVLPVQEHAELDLSAERRHGVMGGVLALWKIGRFEASFRFCVLKALSFICLYVISN